MIFIIIVIIVTILLIVKFDEFINIRIKIKNKFINFS